MNNFNSSDLILKSGKYHLWFRPDKIFVMNSEYYSLYMNGVADEVVTIDLENNHSKAAQIKGSDAKNFRIAYLSETEYNLESSKVELTTHWCGNHWVEYVGLVEVYEHCKICGRKKE